MTHNLADEEEAVYHINFGPQGYFLHCQGGITKLIRISGKVVGVSNTQGTDLVLGDLHHHFPEQVRWSTRPSVLLMAKGLESTW